MRKHFASFGAILGIGILAWPLATYAQPAGGTAVPSETIRPTTDTVTSVPRRAEHEPRAAAGATLSAVEVMKLRQYVTKEKTASVKLAEKLIVGSIVPANVELFRLPADIGAKGDYRYSVVNDHIVLVEAKTHKVSEIIN